MTQIEPAHSTSNTAPDQGVQPRTATVLSLTNQKGGVGKTTTAINLSASLADLGARVLLVDLDPQGNATTGMGLDRGEVKAGAYELLTGTPAVETITETDIPNLSMVPSTIDLAGAEVELVSAFAREMKLRQALSQVSDRFDFIIIDSPPSLGLLAVNALAAAHEVVVPIQCEYYALEGVSQLLRTLELIKEGLNPTLVVGGVVLTMFDARTKLAEQVVSEVKAHFGDVVFRNVIPRSVRLSEAPGFGRPITRYAPSNRASFAYRDLAREAIQRWGKDLDLGNQASLPSTQPSLLDPDGDAEENVAAPTPSDLPQDVIDDVVPDAAESKVAPVADEPVSAAIPEQEPGGVAPRAAAIEAVLKEETDEASEIGTEEPPQRAGSFLERMAGSALAQAAGDARDRPDEERPEPSDPAVPRTWPYQVERDADNGGAE